jgi:hypothetical protein
MVRLFLIVTAVLVIVTASAAANAATVSIDVAAAEGLAGSTVRVPVTIDEVSGLGGLDFILAYDQDVLAVESVAAGSLNKGIIEGNASVPGLLSVSTADPDGMSGPGEVAVITFRVTGAAGQTSDLALSNVQAFDAATLEELPATAQSGTFIVKQAAAGTSTPASSTGSESLVLAIVAVALAAGVTGISRKQR